jgi:hypothetical protein
VAIQLKGKVAENLAVGSALGVLTFLVAALSIFADSRVGAVERDALAPAATSAIAANRIDDPAFDRLYSITDASGGSYGAVITLRSPDSSALIGATFSPKGELRGLRILGACSSRLPADPKESLGRFVGSDGTLDRAANAVRSATPAPNGAEDNGS